jgi:hypothetical protein
MLPKHVALISLSKKITASDLSQTAAALQKQATRDLGPIWNIAATVDYFPDLKSVPLGYWPLIISENIHQSGAAGFHTDKHNQPYSLIELDDTWQLTCSHEMCEMLVDPYGNRLQAAGSKQLGLGKVNFLVEVCDPCEDASFAYSINGILMSDFYTPNYFDPQAVAGVRYSYTGSITEPCQVKKNGYISWQDPATKKWFQATFFGGTKPVTKELKGMQAFGSSLRAQVDKLTKNPNRNTAFNVVAKKHLPLKKKIDSIENAKRDFLLTEISRFISPGKNLTEAPILSPAIVGVVFKNGNPNADYMNATLKDENGKKVGSGKIDQNNLGPIYFDNAPAGYRIDIDGYCLGSAAMSIDIPTTPAPAPSYGPGMFYPSFTC